MRFSFISLAVVVLLLSSAGAAVADEGQWPYDHLPADQLVKTYGFHVDQHWLDTVEGATVRLGTGCTGSFVSADGLVITAEHCTRRCLRQLSSAGHDLVGPGFLADGLAAERRCPAGEVSELLDVSDVTARIQAATAGKVGGTLVDALNRETALIQRQCADAPDIRCEVVSLYQGAVYEAYRYRRFDDVRMVFAPEAQIAFFGGDPDNYNFPRYAFDVGLMRVYVDGKPYRPAHHLSLAGVGPSEGDLVFVSGNPSSTGRAMTMAQLAFERDADLVQTIAFLSEQRGLLTAFADANPADAAQARPDLFRIENDLKVYKGQYQTLARADVWARKQRAEDLLRARVQASPGLAAAAGTAWDEIGRAVEAQRILHERYAMLEEARGFQSALFAHARNLVRLAQEARKPSEDRLPEYSDANLPQLRQAIAAGPPISTRLEIEQLSWSLTKLREALTPDDPLVRAVLRGQTPGSAAERLVNGTRLADPRVRAALMDGGAPALAAARDPMIELAALVDAPARASRRDYEAKVEAPIAAAEGAIARARFALDGFSFSPDATGTLRLSYGRVGGWTEPDGRRIAFFTDIAGLLRRATGTAPFDLPPSWVSAAPGLTPAAHLDFVSTSDTVGGDSGAPVVNRAGELVGVHFDGNAYATGREFVDDEALDRAIGVDVASIREVIGKVYHARALLAELESGARPPQPAKEGSNESRP